MTNIHNYHHVRAAVRGGRKKNPIPQRGLGYWPRKKKSHPPKRTRLLTSDTMPAHQLNSGGNRKGLGTEDWGLANRAREPGTDKQTDGQNDGHFLPALQTSQSRTRVYLQPSDRQTDRMTDIFCRPSRPPNPELGFTTLGQNYNTTM